MTGDRELAPADRRVVRARRSLLRESPYHVPADPLSPMVPDGTSQSADTHDGIADAAADVPVAARVTFHTISTSPVHTDLRNYPRGYAWVWSQSTDRYWYHSYQWTERSWRRVHWTVDFTRVCHGDFWARGLIVAPDGYVYRVRWETALTFRPEWLLHGLGSALEEEAIMSERAEEYN